jgi:hypothetical protein
VLNLNPVAASFEPWWWKYTEQAMSLTDDELAFREMKSFYGFTDLLIGNVPLHKLVAGQSSSVPSVFPAAALLAGGWRSCGEESVMALQPTFTHDSGGNLLHSMK